jgi:hypothetical protein
LSSGELSPAHAAVIAAGTHQLPDHLTADADPILVEAARRLNPPQLRRVLRGRFHKGLRKRAQIRAQARWRKAWR